MQRNKKKKKIYNYIRRKKERKSANEKRDALYNFKFFFSLE